METKFIRRFWLYGRYTQICSYQTNEKITKDKIYPTYQILSNYLFGLYEQKIKGQISLKTISYIIKLEHKLTQKITLTKSNMFHLGKTSLIK